MAPRTVIPIIAGPTAVGKTRTSIEIALSINAEIISADSRQIYRDFHISTACPTAEEQKQVRHHLVQQLDIAEDYSAGVFARRVVPLVQSIQARDKSTLITGGSTLYVHALLEGLSEIPTVDPAIRDSLNQRLAAEGSQQLYTELASIDPEFAQTLDPTKSQRIIRGLEVWEGTGRPLSEFHTTPPLPDFDFQLFVLHRNRAGLYKRIDTRVEEMVAEGLVDEAQRVYEAHHSNELNSLRTIGFQELVPFFEGRDTLENAIELIKRNSRRYAKRQLTWYKRYEKAIWIDVDTTDPAPFILDALSRRSDT